MNNVCVKGINNFLIVHLQIGIVWRQVGTGLYTSRDGFKTRPYYNISKKY